MGSELYKENAMTSGKEKNHGQNPGHSDQQSGKNQPNPSQDVPNKKGPSQDSDREGNNKQKQGDKGSQRHAS